MKKMCPHCNKEMLLKKSSYPLGNINITERFHVDIYECPECRKVEFYAAEEDMVKCPVCGAMHSVHEKCAICALNAAFADHSGV